MIYQVMKIVKAKETYGLKNPEIQLIPVSQIQYGDFFLPTF